MQAFCAHPAGWRLDSLYAPFVYSGSVSVLIGRLKFHRQRWLGRVIGRVLGSTLSGHYDWCMPVPLHRRRLAQRGFNQALEIASGIAASIDGMRLVMGGLERLRNTPPQAQLSVNARKTNLIGCFRVNANVERHRILLVDDVVTTGSTLNTLATLLQQRGAAHVGGVAFARAIGRHAIKV